MTAEEIAPGVLRVDDTCAVYLLVDPDAPWGERDAVAVDFGAGAALDELAGLGIRRITDVVMTHHHRDQGQGLPRALEHGARIHVPPVERELFDRVHERWERHELDNDYDLRQDRFSILEPVAVDGVVPEYRTLAVGAVRLDVLPTPGHTVGSVTYLLDRSGERIAFTGDLVYAPGKVWSLAATQWSYTENEGPAMTVLSCLLLERAAPTLLAPSHGAPMPDAVAALRALRAAMQDYVDSRRHEPWDLVARLDDPYVPLTPHLLRNRTSIAASYVLLSDTGAALLIDYGYDMTTGLVPGRDRSARRPWLASLPALRRRFGVRRIEAALPTHYHDDHVAGMPLLREVEGTELWIPENVAPTLADPWAEDLPCQWYDPIVADRVLALGEPFRWHEYVITAHPQPGHTRYAVAYHVEVDGVSVVFTGDQQEGTGSPGGPRDILNYQYRNLFALGDYPHSAELYRTLAPGLLASGHWVPRWVEGGYVDYLAALADETDELHRRLLPLDELAIPPDGQVARVHPYRSRTVVGEQLVLRVHLHNPLPHAADARVRMVLPLGWRASEAELAARLAAHEEATMEFHLTAGPPGARQRLAADVTVGDLRLGQHADAVVDVVPSA